MSDCFLTIEQQPRRGRKKGGHNKPGHKAGRPRKPSETFDEALWQNGRRRISVGDAHIAESLQRSSSACAIAEAMKQQIPNAVHVSADLATLRWTDKIKQLRYVALTPICAQELIVNFDQGLREKLQPISFDLRPVMIARSGSRRRRVPDAGELRGSGISPAREASASRKLIAYAGKETARERRALSWFSAPSLGKKQRSSLVQFWHRKHGHAPRLHCTGTASPRSSIPLTISRSMLICRRSQVRKNSRRTRHQWVPGSTSHRDQRPVCP
jgi:hypothetical protein